jgi:hypothetical protein
MTVPEKVAGKGSLFPDVAAAAALFVAMAGAFSPALALDPNALPTGGRIVSGQGRIAQSGSHMRSPSSKAR